MNSNPKAVGERTEGFILARLLQLGRAVSLPFGDNQRYDMIVDEGGALMRAQCKTGRLNEEAGFVEFDTRSTNWNSGVKRNYIGQIELFLVYCPQNGKCYRVPIEKCNVTETRLRIRPSKNGQVKRTLEAGQFEF